MTQYLSPAQVAEQLGISLRQVRRYVASGELAASRIGSSHLLRIRSEDVDALMQPVVPSHASHAPQRKPAAKGTAGKAGK